MTGRRLFLWSVVMVVLLFVGNTNVMAQEQEQVQEIEVEQRQQLEQQQQQQQEEELVDFPPSQQRRELWDFFSFVSLMMKIPGPPCTRPNGVQDWGPEGGPRWKRCSEEAGMEEVSEAADVNTSTGTGFASLASHWWLIFVAASVVSATGAIVMGQRKPVGQRRHGMVGSVMRRVGAVSAFAAGALPGRKGSRVVEMKETQGSSSSGYRLDPENPSAAV